MEKMILSDSESVELALVKEVKQLEDENRLDLNVNFVPIDSLEFLNDLDFNEIERMFQSLED